MTDYHINTNNLAPGQKPGDPHPENPWSEHKYPTFFRLFGRGDKEKIAPLDVDDDEFVPQNWQGFENEIKKQAAELQALRAKQQSVTGGSSEQVDFEKYHETSPTEFSVTNETSADQASLTYLSRLVSKSSEVANKLGIRPYNADDNAKIVDLQNKMSEAYSQNNKDLLKQLGTELATVHRRGASDDVYKKYEDQVSTFAKSLEAPYAGMVELSITPEVFRTMGGGFDGKIREGGWYDADYYPEHLRRKWMQSGLVMQVPKSRLDTMTVSDVLGKEIGSKLSKKYWEWNQYTVKLKQQKFASKFLLGVYGGVIFYGLYFKWIQINEKEFLRQKAKHGLRLMYEDKPMTATQYKVGQKHWDWAAKYYDEDDEEEEEQAEGEQEDE